MISKAYIFIDGLEAEPIICGVFDYSAEQVTGRFRYGKSYLARHDAFALDPLLLPLTTNTFISKNNKGIFGVLSDSGADSWGRKIILSLHQTKPQNELEFLLAGNNMGVGALTFSLSRSASKVKTSKNSLGTLPMLVKAKDAILADQTIPEEAKKAFEYGSSMGGARPKTLITDDNLSYIAKFNRPDDLVNNATVENATMHMASELGLNVAPTKVVNTAFGDVLLVERFDINNGRPIHHFYSANSLFNLAKVNEQSLTRHYSYGYIAEFILNHGLKPTQAHELYQRMVFNCLIGNTDDHSRNHALLYCFKQKGWLLSPAYDVLPINNSRQHGIGLGAQGRNATIENLLSQSKRFALKPFKAKKIIKETQELVSQWPQYFASQCVGEGDLERLRGIIPAIQ